MIFFRSSGVRFSLFSRMTLWGCALLWVLGFPSYAGKPDSDTHMPNSKIAVKRAGVELKLDVPSSSGTPQHEVVSEDSTVGDACVALFLSTEDVSVRTRLKNELRHTFYDIFHPSFPTIHSQATHLYVLGVDNETIEGLRPIISTPDSKIISLMLEDSQVSDDGAVVFASILDTNDSIEGLSLSKTKISNRGAEAVFQVVERKPDIRDLFMSENPFDDEVIPSLVEMILQASSLRTLELWRTSIDKGFVDIAAAVERSLTLKNVVMGGYFVKSDALLAMVKMVKNSSSLEILSLDSSVFTTGDKKECSDENEERTIQNALDELCVAAQERNLELEF